MYKHLFGPVPSRRLGISLGVDLVPHKVCSLNCIYCECGSTTRLTFERDEYVPVDEVVDELKAYFKSNPDPDFITFSGAGEPTLHSGIGQILEVIREEKPDIRVALITNGTLLSDPALRKELQDVDVILPSLDAATDAAFKKINRPRKGFSVEQYVKGLIDFKKECKGEFWLEVLILPGYNDDPENILALKNAIQAIGPDRVQLNTLDRPGVIEGLLPATREELDAIVRQWDMEHVDIVVPAAQREESVAFRIDVEAAILETISRRPCTLEDIQQILGIHINEINKYLAALEESGQIESRHQERGVFYQNRMKENEWYSSGKWLEDLQLKPSESVNQQEFEKLYKDNPILWAKAFTWLQTTDLESIDPGTYIIEEDNLKAIVSDESAPELEQVKWEAHRDFSDIQYIVRGKATMGVASVPKAAFAESYDSSKDVGFFEVEGKYYPADPGTFFIFTPEDAHRPGIRVEGFDTVKKVVIKVRVK